MMIDYFRLPSNFPKPDNATALASDCEKAAAIESSIGKDINDRRFIPYIQVHEFEAFLFAAHSGFEYCYGREDDRCKELHNVINNYGNPEEINSSPAGAPSKRIIPAIPEYNKAIDGNIIIMQNGIDAILRTCPRFRNWVETISQRLAL